MGTSEGGTEEWRRYISTHTLIIDIGVDINRMNKMTHYCGRSSGAIGDKSGSDE